jgi:4-amino-4-deoxy-L-arabinose transferase-like glycosyltransferase
MGVDERTTDGRLPWLAAAGIALAVVYLYGFIDSRSTLWDRDEPRFARATVEMIESGNYLYPTFNGRLRPDKPILIYWLMSLPARLLGPTSLAFRCCSSLGIAAACLLTFFMGRRFVGTGGALWAAVILASTLLIIIEGTAATSDGILLPAMVAVMAVFGEAMASGPRWRYVGFMGLALGWGLMAKGPVALLPIPVIGVALWLIGRHRVRAGACLGHLAGATAMGVLLFLAWAVPANNATGGEFLRLGIGHHVLARSARPLEHHGGDFLLHLPYYLPVIVAGFFPWTLHLPGSISAVLGRRVGAGFFRELFLAWVVTVVGIMTLVATKLPHYVLFTWPAMALAVGGTLAALPDALADRDRRWLRGGVYFYGPVAGGMVAGLLAAPFWLHLTGAIVAFWLAAGVLAAMSVVAMRQQLQDRPRASAVTLLAGLAALLFPLTIGVMPELEKLKIAPPLAQAVRGQTASEVPVATFHFGEPTLNFYIGRKIESLAGPRAVADWAQQPSPAVLIIPTDDLSQIEQDHGPLHLRELAVARGLNYANGTPLTVAAMLRQGGSDANRPAVRTE